MKISIITVALNARHTISDCIESVLSQSYLDLEYIIVDGGSEDGTADIIQRYQTRLASFISERDAGMYDAMNKGIRLATGEIIGILNADDIYENERIIASVMEEFKTKKVDSIFGDVVYVDPRHPGKIVRYYRSANFHINQFAYGWMPAHPSFFVKRAIYEKCGLFKTDYQIAADYELLTRFLYTNGISYSYIPEVLVRMRTGGISTRSMVSNWILNKEIVRACQENGIKTNMLKVLSKYPRKIFQLIRKPA